MPPAPKSLPNLPANYTPQFFTADVVTKRDDSTFRARVLRCWSDEEDLPLPALPPGQEHHPLDRPLLRGEVGIRSVPTSDLSIVPESSLELYQRDFHIGDVVKRSLSAVESAVVIARKTEVHLENAIDGAQMEGWVPWSKLTNNMVIEARDRVMFNNWVGIVEEVFEVAKVQSFTGRTTYYIKGSGGMLEVGRNIRETFQAEPTPPVLPSAANPDTDMITEVHAEIVFVTWNAINQELPNSEHDRYPEPQRFWQGLDIPKLALLDTRNMAPVVLGSVVKLRDPNDPELSAKVPVWRPGASRYLPHGQGPGVRVMRVQEARSRVTLRWQDGKQTEEWASSLVPYRNVDDYESWPGEHLIWRNDNGPHRPVCIQSFNPHQRVADVLFMDDQSLSTVSVLELDTGGPGMANYGVGFGQHVLFCKDNDMPLPEVPSLGQMGPPPPWAHDKLHTLVNSHIGHEPLTPEIQLPSGDLAEFTWWGEVVDLHLDGTVSVRLPGGELRREGLKQLILLNDPLGGDVFGDAEEGMADEMEGIVGMDEFLMDILGEGEDEQDAASDASWETVPEVGAHHGAEPRAGVEVIDIDLAESERDVEEVDPMVDDDGEMGDGTMREEPRDGEMEAGPSNPAPPKSGLGLQGNAAWQSFDVLEEAPADHHFFSEPRVGAAKAYHSRLQKEHRALMTSLPENILVRTYEDRSDLMRVLIIGPEGTPYRDAPFVFDVFLSPSKFPHDPPVVFFHSHTNGKGRCNPNLYEDGKVCLSVLGTWAGEKSESWNSKTSSLLQVFVSISGLVLVRHPYHCEPAFAKLEGTSEGRVNSRLYSEKAFVLSRAFIRQALVYPPAGLETELRHFYYTKGKLRTVIEHVKALMEKSDAAGEAGARAGEAGEEVEEVEEEWNEEAMGNLTMGAILTLKRTIVGLEALDAAETGTA